MSKVFSLTQVANTLNVDEKRVKDWLKEGWLLGEKIKTEWHITESNLIDFLAKNPTILLAGSSKGFADGQGKDARLYYPEGVAVDLEGIVYVADTKNHRIRKITQSGEVSTIAGSDEHGFVDDLGKDARFNAPNTVIVDSKGCLYVSDTLNHVIRKIFPDGQVITFAGSGKKGFVDGQATNAKFSRPNGIALDLNGNLYVADTENHAIRKIDNQGVVSTLAGGVIGYSDGKAKDSKFNAPKGLAIDKSGNLYIVDTGNCLVRKLTVDGDVSTIAGRGENCVSSAPENSTPARKAFLYKPKCLVVDNDNNVYVSYQNVVKKISPEGKFTDFAGQGGLPYKEGLAKEAKFYEPEGLAIDSQGSMYIADTSNSKIRKILAPGIISSSFKALDSLSEEEQAKRNIISMSQHKSLKDNSSTDSSELVVTTLFKGDKKTSIYHVAVTPSGKVFLMVKRKADEYHKICQLLPNGELKDIALAYDNVEHTQLLMADPNGNLYQAHYNTIYKIFPSSWLQKNDSMGELVCGIGNEIGCITIDTLGNLYIFETYKKKVYKLTPKHELTLIVEATNVTYPDGRLDYYAFGSVKSMAADKEGNIYLTDNYCIRKIDSKGVISLFASGGLGSKDGVGINARFKSPKGMVCDSDGNLYVCDSENYSVRKISPKAEVSRFVGTKLKGPVDGSIREAQFEYPNSIALDAQGIFYVVDTKSNSLRVIKRADQEINLDPKEPLATSTTEARQKFTIPRAEEFYCLYLDERNNPCGLINKDDVIRKTTLQADIEDILDVLENPSDLGQVIAALAITTNVLARKPEYAERVQSALLNLASDPRIYYAKIEGYNQQVGMVGYSTNQPYYEIVSKKENIEYRFLDITLGIDAALKNPERGNMSIPYQGLDAFYKLFNSLDPKAREKKSKQVGDFFCEIILDKSRQSVERIMAYELIDTEIKRNRETKNSFETLRTKATGLLVNILFDKQENKELQTYIRYNLNKIAPEAVEMLQAKGILPSSPVPSILDIMGSSDIDTSKLNKAAQEVSAGEVLEILQNYRNRDIEKVLPAIYLAPIVARRFNWRAFAQSLTDLLFVYKPYTFKISYVNVLKEISKESSQQLASLLKERPESDKEIVLSYAVKAVEIILDRGFSDFHYSDALNWDLKGIFTSLRAEDVFKNLLMECFCSTWRSPAARFLAYKELGWNAQDAHQKAWEMLLDPLENATFRSLIGTTICNHMKKELAALVDTSQTPWQLLPKAACDLPISYPKESVPEVWLISTLNMSSDNEVLRQAINHLAERLKIDPSYTREELNHTKEKVIALIEKYPDIKEVIKKMCKNTTHKNVAIVAARMLALLGDAEEEETIVGLVADGIDGWTTLKPFSDEWTGIGLVMSVLASNEVTDNVYSVFDPYLIVGYGDERARLMASKVFVLLAQKYEQAGKKEKAVKAYKWAIKRDGYNLVARQGLKKLEEANS